MGVKWAVLDLLLADVTKCVISPCLTSYYWRTAGGGMHSGMPSSSIILLFADF